MILSTNSKKKESIISIKNLLVIVAVVAVQSLISDDIDFLFYHKLQLSGYRSFHQTETQIKDFNLLTSV